MANKEIQGYQVFRKGVYNEWIAEDPILRNGEGAFITDRNELRVGDGVKHFSQIQGIGGGFPEVTSLVYAPNNCHVCFVTEGSELHRGLFYRKTLDGYWERAVDIRLGSGSEITTSDRSLSRSTQSFTLQGVGDWDCRVVWVVQTSLPERYTDAIGKTVFLEHFDTDTDGSLRAPHRTLMCRLNKAEVSSQTVTAYLSVYGYRQWWQNSNDDYKTITYDPSQIRTALQQDPYNRPNLQFRECYIPRNAILPNTRQGSIFTDSKELRVNTGNKVSTKTEILGWGDGFSNINAQLGDEIRLNNGYSPSSYKTKAVVSTYNSLTVVDSDLKTATWTAAENVDNPTGDEIGAVSYAEPNDIWLAECQSGRYLIFKITQGRSIESYYEWDDNTGDLYFKYSQQIQYIGDNEIALAIESGADNILRVTKLWLLPESDSSLNDTYVFNGRYFERKINNDALNMFVKKPAHPDTPTFGTFTYKGCYEQDTYLPYRQPLPALLTDGWRSLGPFEDENTAAHNLHAWAEYKYVTSVTDNRGYVTAIRFRLVDRVDSKNADGTYSRRVIMEAEWTPALSGTLGSYVMQGFPGVYIKQGKIFITFCLGSSHNESHPQVCCTQVLMPRIVENLRISPFIGVSPIYYNKKPIPGNTYFAEFTSVNNEDHYIKSENNVDYASGFYYVVYGGMQTANTPSPSFCAFTMEIKNDDIYDATAHDIVVPPVEGEPWSISKSTLSPIQDAHIATMTEGLVNHTELQIPVAVQNGSYTMMFSQSRSNAQWVCRLRGYLSSYNTNATDINLAAAEGWDSLTILPENPNGTSYEVGCLLKLTNANGYITQLEGLRMSTSSAATYVRERAYTNVWDPNGTHIVAAYTYKSQVILIHESTWEGTPVTVLDYTGTRSWNCVLPTFVAYTHFDEASGKLYAFCEDEFWRVYQIE